MFAQNDVILYTQAVLKFPDHMIFYFPSFVLDLSQVIHMSLDVEPGTQNKLCVFIFSFRSELIALFPSGLLVFNARHT